MADSEPNGRAQAQNPRSLVNAATKQRITWALAFLLLWSLSLITMGGGGGALFSKILEAFSRVAHFMGRWEILGSVAMATGERAFSKGVFYGAA